MHRFRLCLLLAIVAGAFACARAARIEEVDRKCNDRLSALEGRVKSMEDFLSQATNGQYPPPKEPDPKLVYSVPIDGDPAKGPSSAKVTVVEAAEFT